MVYLGHRPRYWFHLLCNVAFSVCKPQPFRCSCMIASRLCGPHAMTPTTCKQGVTGLAWLAEPAPSQQSVVNYA
ncbi:uncharacterized protein EI90DRAFT_3045836 [Cantharellus anzutake]|uniref:uncharacterized protein n=1 Tax=Cantharellus anzutake TaxID=1750568 RepID=UPI001908C814|nr:uncharacterized protein EI90DRAFT_3045836 [Cantharellus anzutake]KAF8336468.1 hypothetical protein EI90DRAFT_3045836 [Cantharellus anzutake]